ncbi:uncharacterized protein N7529_009081 [Penicillium soppii]|jgi:hypothetical protein|uniref:uncharacterized protein n=1 Tax=Penicillium soppii TaxID=69789 RepID=UPI0025474E97|nr:uncharacterized protein N7529_009081 [Penicillium soppii]KAJ5861771.1 hypothetical protein N7529_009081 [Penicillium soppii]
MAPKTLPTEIPTTAPDDRCEEDEPVDCVEVLVELDTSVEFDFEIEVELELETEDNVGVGSPSF